MKLLTVFIFALLLLNSTCKKNQTKTEQPTTTQSKAEVKQEQPTTKASTQPVATSQPASTSQPKNLGTKEKPYYAEGNDNRPPNVIFAEQIAKAKAEREKNVIKVEGEKTRFRYPSKDTRLAYMEKTPCFGKCKNYKLSIYEDGTTVFEGIRFIVRLGHYKTKVDEATLKEIKGYIAKMDYFSLSEEYPNDGSRIMDLPSVITSVQLDGKEKTIINKLKAPQALIDYQIFLENILLTHTWQPVEIIND